VVELSVSEIVLCKRCNRPITGELSISRGYGYRCWRVHQLEKKNPKPSPDRITILEEEIKNLKREVQGLKISTVTHQTSLKTKKTKVPSMNGSPVKRTVIPVLRGGWDMGELKDHPLFQEQKKKCEDL